MACRDEKDNCLQVIGNQIYSQGSNVLDAIDKYTTTFQIGYVNENQLHTSVAGVFNIRYRKFIARQTGKNGKRLDIGGKATAETEQRKTYRLEWNMD
jgi:hypothetical protein